MDTKKEFKLIVKQKFNDMKTFCRFIFENVVVFSSWKLNSFIVWNNIFLPQ